MSWYLYLFVLVFLFTASLFNAGRARYDPEDRGFHVKHAFRYLTLGVLMSIGGLALATWHDLGTKQRNHLTAIHDNVDNGFRSANKSVSGAMTTISQGREKHYKNELESLELLRAAVETNATLQSSHYKNELTSLNLLRLAMEKIESRKFQPPVELPARGTDDVMELKNILEKQDPMLFNSPSWQVLLYENLSSEFRSKLLYKSAGFSTNQPYAKCDCATSSCGYPKLQKKIKIPDRQPTDLMYIVIGRHDARPMTKNSELSMRRAECIALKYGLTEENTVLIGAPFRQITETGDVLEDRRVEVYAVEKRPSQEARVTTE